MINEVRLIGNVGNDPEIRSERNYTMAKLSLATTDKWKDKKTGEWQEKTQWHRLVAFGYPAEYIDKFVAKGTLLYIEGSIEYGSYEKNGEKVYTTDIKVQRAKVMSKGKERSNEDGYGGERSFPPPPTTEGDVPF